MVVQTPRVSQRRPDVAVLLAMQAGREIPSSRRDISMSSIKG